MPHNKFSQETANKTFPRPPEALVEKHIQLIRQAIADGMEQNPNVSPESAFLAGFTMAAQTAYMLSNETISHAKIMRKFSPEAQTEMEKQASGMFAACCLLFHISNDILNQNEAITESLKNDPNNPF